MRIRCWMLLAALTTIAGCTSPEAARTRGGGPGADRGNRQAIVKMHEGSSPYWKTPVVIPSQGAPLEPARHAQRVSRQ